MNHSLGEVWILKDGSPNRILVNTGLSNNEYTELIGDKLSAGTSVIVRVSRRQHK